MNHWHVAWLILIESSFSCRVCIFPFSKKKILPKHWIILEIDHSKIHWMNSLRFGVKKQNKNSKKNYCPKKNMFISISQVLFLRIHVWCQESRCGYCFCDLRQDIYRKTHVSVGWGKENCIMALVYVPHIIIWLIRCFLQSTKVHAATMMTSFFLEYLVVINSFGGQELLISCGNGLWNREPGRAG